VYPSIYTRLRAINSFLPVQSELNALKQSKDLKEFEQGLRKLRICQRFPLQHNSVEDYLQRLPFRLSSMVLAYLSGRSAYFYQAYCRFYELEDIKRALHGHSGSYLLFLEEPPSDIQKISDHLKETPWSAAWQKASARYRDTQNLFDIEAILDQNYYQHMLTCSRRLYANTRRDTQEFLTHWINLKNRLWFYRLTHYYEMEHYHIKRLLIAAGETYQNITAIDGMTDRHYRSALTKYCYWQFKMNVLSMAAILSFSVYFQLKIKELLSIYYSKILGFSIDRIEQILGGA